MFICFPYFGICVFCICVFGMYILLCILLYMYTCGDPYNEYCGLLPPKMMDLYTLSWVVRTTVSSWDFSDRGVVLLKLGCAPMWFVHRSLFGLGIGSNSFG
jgi:hypothetical protein